MGIFDRIYGFRQREVRNSYPNEVRLADISAKEPLSSTYFQIGQLKAENKKLSSIIKTNKNDLGFNEITETQEHKPLDLQNVEETKRHKPLDFNNITSDNKHNIVDFNNIETSTGNDEKPKLKNIE